MRRWLFVFLSYEIDIILQRYIYTPNWLKGLLFSCALTQFMQGVKKLKKRRLSWHLYDFGLNAKDWVWLPQNPIIQMQPVSLKGKGKKYQASALLTKNHLRKVRWNLPDPYTEHNWLSHNSVYSSMFYYIFDGLRYQCLVVLNVYSLGFQTSLEFSYDHPPHDMSCVGHDVVEIVNQTLEYNYFRWLQPFISQWVDFNQRKASAHIYHTSTT